MCLSPFDPTHPRELINLKYTMHYVCKAFLTFSKYICTGGDVTDNFDFYYL